jgi:pyruvate dehydrogenase E1 component alpha subunit
VPRKPIKIKPKLEYLSILDGKGKLDKTLDPKLDDEVASRIFKLMLLARRLDERCINLQRQGRIGTYAPCRGQEASHCAAAVCMEPEDWVVQEFREPGLMHHRGWPVEAVFRFWGGYEEGCVPPPGVNDLPISVPIATQCQHAMGIAWAIKTCDHEKAVLCFFGDGATSEGDFHEAMNFAGAYQLPVVFLATNNQWAISVPRSEQTASETIAQKSIAYGFDGIQVDGNDPLAVYVATREAVDKAKGGGGPTLIEAVTYRLSMHTTADDPTKYRSDEEVKKWEKLDPIPRYEKYLRDRGLLDDAIIEQLESEIHDEIAAAVERYENDRAADPLDCFDYTYTQLPEELIRQRQEFAEALKHEGNGKNH